MAYYATELEKLKGKTFSNQYGAQCVAFVQQVTKAANTQFWKKGRRVYDAKVLACMFENDLRPGIVIATFDEFGRYPSENQHVAIFLRPAVGGFVVLDQWVGKTPVSEHTLIYEHRFKNMMHPFDPMRYFVVE